MLVLEVIAFNLFPNICVCASLKVHWEQGVGEFPKSKRSWNALPLTEWQSSSFVLKGGDGVPGRLVLEADSTTNVHVLEVWNKPHWWRRTWGTTNSLAASTYMVIWLSQDKLALFVARIFLKVLFSNDKCKTSREFSFIEYPKWWRRFGWHNILLKHFLFACI